MYNWITFCTPETHATINQLCSNIKQNILKIKIKCRCNIYNSFSCISCIGRQILYHWAAWKVLLTVITTKKKERDTLPFTTLWLLPLLEHLYQHPHNTHPYQYQRQRCLSPKFGLYGRLISIQIFSVENETRMSMQYLNRLSSKYMFVVHKYYLKNFSLQEVIKYIQGNSIETLY